MRTPLFALIRKDLKAYFDQPTGYILIVVFVALISWAFFRTAFLNSEASLRPLFTVDTTIDRPSLPWLLAFFVPAATMRLLAEEQRDGTLEILLTQPIRAWTVLVAKFLAGLIFVTVAILATTGIPIALSTAGNLDKGAIVAQYVGSIFLAASLVSVGLFTSSLTRNQIVAFIVGLTVIIALMVVGLDRVAVTLPTRISGLLQTLSPLTHFSTMARGVIDLRDVIYFIALVFTFLSATFLMLRAKSLSHLSSQYRNLQLGVAGLIVFSLLVGWFGSSISGRLDLTDDKVFSLSRGTRQILDGLDDLLTVELYRSKDPPPQVKLVGRDVSDFLKDFAASHGKVKLIERFPDDDEDDARKAQFAGVPPVQFNVQSQGELQIKTGYLGVAMTYIDRREVIPFVSTVDGFEYNVATIAYSMLQQDRKTVAFLTGHGEKSKDTDLQAFSTVLGRQYEVIEVSASDDAPLDLSGIDVLIVAGPTQEVSPGVQEALHRYLADGGKAMILVDPVVVDQQRLLALPNRQSFSGFVERYAVLVENNIVFDIEANEVLRFSNPGGSFFLPYAYWIHVPTVDTKVTGEVDSALFPWASSLGVAESAVGRVEVIPLLRTQSTAAVDYEYGDVTPDSPQLVLTDREQFASDIGVAIAGDEAGGPAFRLVVVGDSDWITNALVTRAPQNQALALNLVDWLAQEDSLAEVRSKVVPSRRIDFSSSTQKNLVQYANIFGVPLAFVALGLFRFLRRQNIGRRTYSREE